MSTGAATRDEGIRDDVVGALTKRLKLTDDGTTYVRRYVVWRLRNDGWPASKWPKRPRCPFSIPMGAHLRAEANAELEPPGPAGPPRRRLPPRFRAKAAALLRLDG